MKTYTLSLSTSIVTNNQNISLIDETNLSNVKWFVNWGQFFNYEDHNKRCKIKAKLVSKKSSSLTHDANLGFLCASLPSTNCNMLSGSVLGQTFVNAAVGSTTDFYLSCDTLQENGLQGLIPNQASELNIILLDVDGLPQPNVPEYILTLVFDIEDEE